MSSAQEEFDELMRDKSRSTTHPEDYGNLDDQSVSASDHESDDPIQSNYLRSASARNGAQDHPPGPFNEMAPRPSLSIPRTRHSANTGPKGVITDAQDYHAERKKAAQEKRVQQNRLQNGLSTMYINEARGRVPEDEKKFGQVEAEQKVRARDDEDEVDGEDLDIEDELDDEFMQAWRQARLRDMQQSSTGPTPDYDGSAADGKSRVNYGGLGMVDADGYLDAVDNSPAQTVVVVYIYDDYSHVSRVVEECVRALAEKHRQTRFVKLHFEDAEIEPAGVPALIAYRAGSKFAALVPIIDELPDDAELCPATFEKLLQRHQILR